MTLPNRSSLFSLTSPTGSWACICNDNRPPIDTVLEEALMLYSSHGFLTSSAALCLYARAVDRAESVASSLPYVPSQVASAYNAIVAQQEPMPENLRPETWQKVARGMAAQAATLR